MRTAWLLPFWKTVVASLRAGKCGFPFVSFFSRTAAGRCLREREGVREAERERVAVVMGQILCVRAGCTTPITCRLSLYLMEEFRSLIVDSVVITAINTGMVQEGDFTTAANACQLSATGRKSFLRAYESRMDQIATHPVFDYRLSWRRLVAMQAQLLARHLRGELAVYPGITTR